MSEYKQGVPFQALGEFTPEEWSEIYPWDSIRSEAQTGQTEHEMTITVMPEVRAILIEADTHPMALGTYIFDVLTITNGKKPT